MIFLLKCLSISSVLAMKLLMRLAVGMEGLMTVCFANRAPVFEELFCSPAEVGGRKRCQINSTACARVEHVFLVKTVVAQLIVHKLIGWEIAHYAWILPHQLIGGQQERSLRELAAMIAVFRVSDGTYGDDDLQSAFTPLRCCGLRSFSKSTACCR